jgi:serine phosphatase RsbU (regulator of sigma subunit)
MPCRSYDDDFRTTPDPAIQEKLDRLSRIACKALTHIEESGDGLEILILKDPEIQEWWTAHKEADRKEKEKELARRRATAEKAALTRRKNEIKARLTQEELKILGVK